MATKFVLKKSLPKARTTDNPALGEYVFDGDMFTVGSDAANNLVLAEGAPEQSVVVREGDRLTLLNSADGTRLNGQNLRREAIQPLANGDEIRIGNYVILIVEDETDSPLETSEQKIQQTPKTALFDKTANGLAAENGVSVLPEREKRAEDSLERQQTSARNFADILDTLRTEEDSFYFIVENGDAETDRVMLEQVETPIGASNSGSGSEIAFVIERISTLFAVARKDWSGILLESKRRNSVFVNGEAVETTRRLRNDDRVSFSAPSKFVLVLHEPSSLVALESLLSARVDSSGTRFGGLVANDAGTSMTADTKNAAPAAAKQKASLLDRRYFGYFTFVEVVTMIIGTLIGAVLFFLFFEFMFS